MNTSTEAPLTIGAEAAERIAELGMQKELQQMIAYVRETVPGLNAIAVEIAECYDTREETGVSIIASSDRIYEPGDTTSWDSIGWAVNTFAPRVLEHLCILFRPGRPHAG